MEKIIESIETAEASLVAKKTSDMVLIKENLASLKQSLTVLQSAAKAQKAGITTIDKPQVADVHVVEAPEELKITESNENIVVQEEAIIEEKKLDEKLVIEEKASELQEEVKPINKPEEQSVEATVVIETLNKSKEEIENVMLSIKKARRPPSEVQAVEKVLTTTYEQISELSTDQTQLEKVIEYIETAEASLVTKKTSDMVLIKENLASLKQSLTVLQSAAKAQKAGITTIDKPQVADVHVAEAPEELKITESNENIVVQEEAIIEEKKLDEKLVIEEKAPELQERVKPIDKPEEQSVEATVVIETLNKSKEEIENVMLSIKKARRPPSEVQAVEKVLTTTYEQISELSTDQTQLEKVIESIETAEASLVAKKTSDMVLIKENLASLKQSLTVLQSAAKAQKAGITTIDKPQVADVHVADAPEELKITESNENIVVQEEAIIEEKKLDEKLVIEEKPPELQEEVKPINKPEEQSVEATVVIETLNKSKEEIENVMVSIKKARRPPSEVQAVEKVLTTTYEQISELSTDQTQLEKIIESIETAEASLVAKKTSDMVLIKENLASLKQSLTVLQSAAKAQKAGITTIDKPQVADVHVAEAPEELKITESNENIVVQEEAIIEEKKLDEKLVIEEKAPELQEEVKPINKPEEQSVEATVVIETLNKSKEEIENVMLSIKKARRPPSEVQAVEKVLTTTYEQISELSTDQTQLEKVIESIETAEASLVAKKTSDMVLIKENLASLKQSLTVLQSAAKAQKAGITTIDKPQVADVHVADAPEELKITESNENIVVQEEAIIEEKKLDEKLVIEEKPPELQEEVKPINKPEEQSVEATVVIETLNKSKEEIENVMVSIKKARRPPSEVQAVEKVLTTTYEQISELSTDQTQLEKIIESIETAEASLVAKKTSDMVLIKENLASLKQSLTVLQSAAKAQKAGITTIDKPQVGDVHVAEAPEELKITESNENIVVQEEAIIEEKKLDEKLVIEEKAPELQEEVKPIDKPEEQSVEATVVIETLNKSKEEIENVMLSIKKARRPPSEVQAVEKVLTTTYEQISELSTDQTQLEKVIESIETAEASLVAKKTSDMVLIKENLASLKQSLTVLQSAAKAQKAGITTIDKPQVADVHVAEAPEEIKITESNENIVVQEEAIIEEKKLDEKLVIEEKTPELQEEVKPINKPEAQSVEATVVIETLNKSKEEIENVMLSIKKARRPPSEVQAVEKVLTTTYEQISELSTDQTQLEKIIESIETAEASLVAKKTSDMVLIKENLASLKQSLTVLQSAAKAQNAGITTIDKPQVADVHVAEAPEELKITESNENIVVQEEAIIEEKKLDEKLVIDEKAPELQEEVKPINKPEEQSVEATVVIETLNKSKEEIENVMLSIKKARRPPSEVQAVEKVLTTTYEQISELSTDQTQLEKVIESIETAEASLVAKKTSDMVLIKENLASLKQSLTVLHSAAKAQKAGITTIDKPQVADVHVAEAPEELKITESNENIVVQEEAIIEEKKLDEKLVIEEKAPELQEEVKPIDKPEEQSVEATVVIETLNKSKEEIENVMLSIKKARRPPSEVQAVEKVLTTTYEQISELSTDQTQLERVIESIETAEASLVAKKTSDMVLIKENLASLKQSLTVLQSAAKAQKAGITTIDKPQVADVHVAEAPEELKITESNENIVVQEEAIIEEKKLDEKLVIEEKAPELQEEVKPINKPEEQSVEATVVIETLNKSKEEIENVMLSIKKARRPPSEVQAVEKVLTTTYEQISELSTDQTQLEKVIESIETAEASLVAKKTSDMVLIKENLASLKQSLTVLQSAAKAQKAGITTIDKTQVADVHVAEAPEELKITESNENIVVQEEAIIEEKKLDEKLVIEEKAPELQEEVKPIDKPEEQSVEATVVIETLNKSKEEIENVMLSIKKARRPPSEVQAVEKVLTTTYEQISELSTDQTQLEKVIESIETAEASLVAKKTSDMVLIKENLASLKQSLTVLQSAAKAQKAGITTIDKPQVADVHVAEAPEELKITESNENIVVQEEAIIEEKKLDEKLVIEEKAPELQEEVKPIDKPEEQSVEATVVIETLNKSKEEIENVMLSIKKARRPPSEVQAVEKVLTTTYEQISELSTDQTRLEKVIEYVETAEASLVAKKTSDMVLIKENLASLKQSLTVLLSAAKAQKAGITTIDKPQVADVHVAEAPEEIKITESNENIVVQEEAIIEEKKLDEKLVIEEKAPELQEEVKPIDKPEEQSVEATVVIETLNKSKEEIENVMLSIKKARRPPSEVQAVEKVLTTTYEQISELSTDQTQLEKVIESIETAEASLVAKKTSDMVLIKENLASLKQSLTVLQSAAKAQKAGITTIDKPQVADVHVAEAPEELKITESNENIVVQEEAIIEEKKLDEKLVIEEKAPELQEEVKPIDKPEEQSVEATVVIETLNKSKEEIENVMLSIKKARRPPSEVQAVEKVLTTTYEQISELSTDQTQLEKVIESIETAEASLVAKKTSDMVLIKENLASLKQSLTVLQSAAKAQKAGITTIDKPQVADVHVAEAPEELKITESNENIVVQEEDIIEEKKLDEKLVIEEKAPELQEEVKPINKSEEQSVEAELFAELNVSVPSDKVPEPIEKPADQSIETTLVLTPQLKKTKQEIENVIVSIKKARRPTIEVQDFEKSLTINLAKISELESNQVMLDELKKSIETTEASLTAKKTSDMVLIKENLSTLKQSLVDLQSSTKAQETEITVKETDENIAAQEKDIVEKISDDKLVAELNVSVPTDKAPEPIEKPADQSIETTLVLTPQLKKTKQEIENVIVSIKKARRPTIEVQDFEKSLTINLAKISELESNQVMLDELKKSIETTEASLTAKKTSDMVLIKENLSTLKQSLVDLQSSTKAQETEITVKETDENIAAQEKDIVEKISDEKLVAELNVSVSTDKTPEPIEKPADQPAEKSAPLTQKLMKVKQLIQNVIVSIKKARRPTIEVLDVEKSLSIALDNMLNLQDNQSQLEKIIKNVETAESSLTTKKTNDMLSIKSDLSQLKEYLWDLQQPNQLKDNTEAVVKGDVNQKCLDERNLQLQHSLNIKQEIAEILVLIKKSRRVSSEVQALNSVLLNLEENLEKLYESKSFFDDVILTVSIAKQSLLNKRTMELILLRDKVTSLEQSLRALKRSVSDEEKDSIKNDDIGDVLASEIVPEKLAKEDEVIKEQQLELQDQQLEKEPEKPMRKKKIAEKDKTTEEEKSLVDIEPKESSRVDTSKDVSADKILVNIEETKLSEETEKVAKLSPVYENGTAKSLSEQEPEKPLRRRKLEETKVLQTEDQSSSQDSLRVTEPRRRESKRMPTFIARLKNRSASENSIIKFTCAVSEPECSVQWSKDGVSLKKSEKYSIDSNNGVLSLEIKKATIQDAGDYSCVVSNNYGEIETSAVLTIFGEEVQQTTSTFTKNLKGE